MRSSDVGFASLVSESAFSAASCLDVSRSCAPLSSAPASPACSSPEAYIAMPSLSQAGMRPPLRLTSAAWTSSCATVIRRWSALLFPYERHRMKTRWPETAETFSAGPSIATWASATATSDLSVL